MYIRKITALAIAVALLATTIACSSGGMDTNTDLKSSNSKELSMYIMDYDTNVKML